MADDIVKNIKNCFLIRYDKSASSVRVRRFLYTDVTRCRFFTTEPQSTQRAPTAQSARSGRTAVDIVVDCTSFLCFSYSKRKDTILLLRQRREGHCRVRVYSLFIEQLSLSIVKNEFGIRSFFGDQCSMFNVQCSMKKGVWGNPPAMFFPLCVLCDSVVKISV